MGRKKLTEEEKELRKIIAENLRRLSRGRSQAWLSDNTGIRPTTLNGYFNASSTINAGNVEKIAKALGVPKSDIDPRMYINKPLDTSKIIPISDFTTIPILGSIPCGYPAEKEPEQIGELMIEKKDVRGGEYFALYADGDSMTPTINDGETVVVRRQPDAESGELVAACVDGAITLKRLKRIGKQMILMPDNPSYEPIELSEEAGTYIVGKVTRAINVRDF